jgi:hypothetical protein
MKNPAIGLLALLVLAAAPAAHAQDGAAYYGVSFGNFEYDEGDGPGFVSDEASSWRLMVNYQFMEYLAVEGGYGQTSTIRDTLTVPNFPVGTVDLNFSAEFSRILTVRLLGVLPLDNFKLMAGLGYSDMKFEFDVTDGVDSLSGDISSNEPGYYVGVQYDWDRFAMRLGYEKFDYDPSEFDDSADVSETMLTFFYKL